MASKRIYDVCVSTGSYTGQDGQEKQRWMNVGVMFKNDSGYVSIKLEAIPTRRNEDGELWLSCFAPKEKQAPQQQGFREQSQRGADGFEDAKLPNF
jgi:hypothetical protein